MTHFRDLPIRRKLLVMTLTSTGFTDGGQIPAKYAQPGEEVSPPVAWTGTPDSTVSFVLLAHDVDAAIGNGTDDLLHDAEGDGARVDR